MYETEIPETKRKHSFSETLTSIPGTIDSRMPTLDKRMDRYFDEYMPGLIEEWGFVTLSMLEQLERRLDMVSLDIQVLEKGRAALQTRARAVDEELRGLEEEVEKQ
ncbi:hypothetical protein AZH53_00425 [Methanomicrobiaceae archaeon CYW5]|uniref:hypothetical protein n=1 Tax=Methanovulcanius yangii TaxID=1789227 RepID=UPI0029C9E545|nr:hypothetical protein [Methanovulcanius yangii]MBT8506894.1 hypothetical protein [Methanovulcanius yangii]